MRNIYRFEITAASAPQRLWEYVIQEYDLACALASLARALSTNFSDADLPFTIEVTMMQTVTTSNRNHVCHTQSILGIDTGPNRCVVCGCIVLPFGSTTV